MKSECIELLVWNNREIEFEYNNKKYSITYCGEGDKRKDKISFCEFYQKPTNVETVEELLELRIEGLTLEEILSKVSDEAIYIY